MYLRDCKSILTQGSAANVILHMKANVNIHLNIFWNVVGIVSVTSRLEVDSFLTFESFRLIAD